MENINLFEGADERRVDCAVLKKPKKSSVLGTVKDAENKPIAKVCVKVLSESYEPLTHTITDSYGNFTLVFPPIQGYFLVFSKQGYFTKTLQSFSPEVEIVLENREVSCLVTGKVYTRDCKALESVRLTLCSTKTGKVAYTNKDGSFAFTLVPAGEYILTIEGNTCRKKTMCVKVLNDVTHINLGIIFVEQIDVLCTIHGIVSNDKKEPVNNAVVVLYNACNKRPIAHTVTNEDGLYFFGNIYKGCYFVEAFE